MHQLDAGEPGEWSGRADCVFSSRGGPECALAEQSRRNGAIGLAIKARIETAEGKAKAVSSR